MPPPSGKKILTLVLLAHVMLIGLIILGSQLSAPHYYATQMTAVDLVEPVEISPRQESVREEAPPPPEAEIPVSEPEEPKKTRKKITRKIREYKIPTSDLKKRLEERLQDLKSPPRSSSAKSAVSTASPEKKFPFSWYKNFVASRIYSLWKRPARTAVGKREANALISFRVFRDGHIENIRLKESSGSSIVDQSAMRAVKLSDPLPHLPEGFKGTYEDFAILFELSDPKQ